MRSVFAAGLLDGFLEQEFRPFDFCIGVSGGAVNLMSYVISKPGLSFRIYRDFARNPRFISYRRFLMGGHLMDLDWLLDEVSSELAEQIESGFEPTMPLHVGVTDVHTGSVIYHQLALANYRRLLLATSALPFIYRDFPRFGERTVTDGGVSESVPVAEAIRWGARHVMVVRSRPWNYVKKDTLMHRYIRYRLRQYPALVKTMAQRSRRHRETIQLLRNPPAPVQITEVCPPDTLGLGRFTRHPTKIETGYRLGREASLQAIRSWTTNHESGLDL